MMLLNFNASAKSDVIGQAYYAIQNETFPCKEALQVYKDIKHHALSWLYGTFGDNWQCVDDFVYKLPGKKKMYIHFSNECCRRNRTCKKGELLKNMSVSEFNTKLENKNKKVLNEINKRIAKLNGKIAEYHTQGVEVILSTGLEDNYTRKAFKVMYNQIKNNSIADDVIQSPLKNCYLKNKCEWHDKSKNGKAYLFMPDGYCVENYDNDKCKTNLLRESELNELVRNRNGKNFFMWWSNLQGRYGESPAQAKPPRKRVIVINKNSINKSNKILRKGN